MNSSLDCSTGQCFRALPAPCCRFSSYRFSHHLEDNSWIPLSFCFTWTKPSKNLGAKTDKRGWWFVWPLTGKLMDGDLNISLFSSIPSKLQGMFAPSSLAELSQSLIPVPKDTVLCSSGRRTDRSCVNRKSRMEKGKAHAQYSFSHSPKCCKMTQVPQKSCRYKISVRLKEKGRHYLNIL